MYAYSLSLPALLFQHRDGLARGHISLGMVGHIDAPVRLDCQSGLCFCRALLRKEKAGICGHRLCGCVVSWAHFLSGPGVVVQRRERHANFWARPRVSYLAAEFSDSVGRVRDSSGNLNPPLNTDAGDETARAG